MQGTHRAARRPARLALAGAAMLTLAAAFGASPASAAPSGTLSMSPTNISIAQNDTIAITLDLTGAANVHEVQFTVSYNTAVVEVVDADGATPGTQILPGAFPGTVDQGTVLQNSAAGGTIAYQFRLDDPNATASGGGTMATVQFHAVGVGNANITWSAVTLSDDAGGTSTPSGSASVLAVGQAVPTSTPTPTPTATATLSATDTPVATTTGTPQPTDTPEPTTTGTPSPSRTPTASPQASATPSTTNTPHATATPRVTVIGQPPQQGGGVDPAQAARANGLPSAGTEGPGIQWWRWVFFLAALMLGVAGWFFTFAVHYGDREPVIIDKFDRRRRTRRRY